MKRQKQAQKLGNQMKDFLKKNPAVKEALRVFDISCDQYQKALESGYSYYTLQLHFAIMATLDGPGAVKIFENSEGAVLIKMVNIQLSSDLTAKTRICFI